MKKYDVAAYVWPAYTGDESRTHIFWPKGFGEWETLMEATPSFEGHTWPRKPLWGYVNEANPAVMEMEINEAVRHGVNVFIYDWYWFDRRPFLENCLNDGFLKARNNKDMKFYLMWANHNVDHLWDRRLAAIEPEIIWRGTVNRAEFEEMADRMIDKYFSIENYYRIDDKPVFMIYDIENLVRGFGTIDNTRKALDWLREACVQKGHKGLHLQLLIRGDRKPHQEAVGEDITYQALTSRLGADSVTCYHMAQLAGFKSVDYVTQMNAAEAIWQKIDEEYTIPFFPNVACGWDNSPRRVYKPKIVTGNTPDKVETALWHAKEYIDTHPLPVNLITVNSWNEWTEGGYLEPDDLYGYGYLEAVKKVFADTEE